MIKANRPPLQLTGNYQIRVQSRSGRQSPPLTRSVDARARIALDQMNKLQIPSSQPSSQSGYPQTIPINIAQITCPNSSMSSKQKSAAISIVKNDSSNHTPNHGIGANPSPNTSKSKTPAKEQAADLLQSLPKNFKKVQTQPQASAQAHTAAQY